MLKSFILLLAILTSLAVQGAPTMKDLVQYSLQTKELGKVDFYVSKKGIDTKKPVLLLLDGSGGQPLFRYKIDSASKSSIMYASLPFDLDSISNKYHLVLISKPGIKLADTFYVPSLDSNIAYPEVPEYNQRLSAAWRAGAASEVVNYVVKHLPVDKKKVVAMGLSEGAQVAPRVAAMNMKITHVVCFCGNGVNQFYDFVIQERMRVLTGEISDSMAQDNIDTLMVQFADIYKHPKAKDKYWAGHTYKRWAGFCEKDPMDYMLALDIPIYMAHGTADDNTQILSTDYVALEFLRKGKTNLTYKTYPGYNHYFQQVHKDKPPVEKIDEVTNEVLRWLEEH
jgi:pimeloyl-ACP methyl ester carboxylesterase